MRKLVEYSTQESKCRQRAVLDAANRAHWLLQAEMWQQRVAQEISSYLTNAIRIAQATERNQNERMTEARRNCRTIRGVAAQASPKAENFQNDREDADRRAKLLIYQAIEG